MKILSNNIVKGVLAAGTLATAMLLTGCGSTKSLAPATVKLSVWCDERNHSLINEIITDFKEEYEGEALFDITVSDESELTCKETVLANPEAAADVFTFADDQLEEMWRAGALLEITENTESIIAANGGEDSGACRAAMREGKLFGYPETAGNGYFLFYNSAYFTEEDIRSLDTILDICAANNKKMLMYGKEASNRKQEIDRQHHTIPNKRTKDQKTSTVEMCITCYSVMEKSVHRTWKS